MRRHKTERINDRWPSREKREGIASLPLLNCPVQLTEEEPRAQLVVATGSSKAWPSDISYGVGRMSVFTRDSQREGQGTMMALGMF